MNTWFGDALAAAGITIAHEVIRKSAEDFAQQAKTMQPLLVGDMTHRNAPYARYVEYGYPPATTGAIIDSTATVIDDEVLALPSPHET